MTVLRLTGGYTAELVVDVADLEATNLDGVVLALALSDPRPASSSPLWRAAGTGAVARVSFVEADAPAVGEMRAWVRMGTGPYTIAPVLDDDGRPLIVTVS